MVSYTPVTSSRHKSTSMKSQILDKNSTNSRNTISVHTWKHLETRLRLPIRSTFIAIKTYLIPQMKRKSRAHISCFLTTTPQTKLRKRRRKLRLWKSSRRWIGTQLRSRLKHSSSSDPAALMRLRWRLWESQSSIRTNRSSSQLKHRKRHLSRRNASSVTLLAKRIQQTSEWMIKT